MSNQLLVSILIPAYNAQKWIEETILSAINQTWPSKEIIIIDDGSTDETLNVIRNFESSKLKIIHQDNSGACHARNRAFQVCQGDYIQWLDADDILAPDKIERQMNFLRITKDPSIVCTGPWGRFYYRPNKTKFTPTPLWRDHTSVEWLILRFSNPYMMPLHSWLVSRNLSESVGPWDERLLRNQDGEYFTRVVCHSSMVRFIPNAYSYYRIINSDSITNTTSRKAWESIFLSSVLETQHVIAREDSERIHAVCNLRLNLVAFFLDPYAPDLADQLRAKVIELGGNILITKPCKYVSCYKNILGEKFTRNLISLISQIRQQILCKTDKWLAKLFGVKHE